MSKEKYYLIEDLPYEGSMVIPYSTMASAQQAYREGLEELQSGAIQGLAVICGRALKAVGSLKNLKDNDDGGQLVRVESVPKTPRGGLSNKVSTSYTADKKINHSRMRPKRVEVGN